ncbi:MAG TPA: SusC/RagA family TonB-linked outer membrane protein [Puia sp.]|jgi:TonB-linked SusC/RagA family outer membrane protein|nr:SusC/RagA family TonB-linked outer membrane protein [Puia sp.]
MYFESKRFAELKPLSKDRSPGKIIIKVVKLTALFIFIACLHVSAHTNAQVLNISLKNRPLETLFKEIEKKTNYTFFYDVAILKSAKPVTVELKQASVEEVLKAALKDEPLDFMMTSNTIFIKRKLTLNIAVGKVDQVTGEPHVLPEITGTVEDENGQPLSGASIKLKNGKVLAITDEKGWFKLKNVSKDATLEISYTGYSTKLIPLGDKTSIEVTMTLATNNLDEAHVIAYGLTTERLTTGDVTKVTAKEIEAQPVGNVLAAIEGRVPGLLVTQTSGLPGGSFTTQIRGQSSLFSGTDPFYVIDGVPYNSELPTANGFGLINGSLNGGNPLNFINPYDIESIEVLKDADATAIYGSQAANGAILITTKRGKVGKMALNLSVNSGVSSPTRDITLMNTQQYLKMRHEAFANDGRKPSSYSDFDLTFWDTARYTNWGKALIDKRAVYTDAEASVSGGTTNTQYVVGGGYNQQSDGMPVLVPGAGKDERGSVHFNINTQSPDKRFKLTLTASYAADKNTIEANDLAYSRFLLAPDAPPLYNSDGSLNWDPMAPGQAGTWGNPLSNLLTSYKGITSNVVGSATLSYMAVRGLEIKANLGYTNTQTNEVMTSPVSASDPGLHITSGSSIFSAFNTHSWIIEPQAEYKVRLGRGVLGTLLGGSFHENDQAAQVQDASGFISDALLQDIEAASNVEYQNSSAQYRYDAIFGRLSYNWDDKYILNLNARRDGSSRFGAGKQFGNFGSAGAAWIFSGEKFVQQLIPALSFGKLRASYGTTGNDQIGDYQFLNLYSVSQFQYESRQLLYPTSLANPDLAWEIDKKLEVGIELGFLKDRILLQASFFRNRSGNQLVSEGVSLVTGFYNLPINLPALIQNSGQEMTIRTTIVRTKNFSWTSNFNLTIPHNKLLSFPGLATSSYAYFYKIGQPISSQPAFHYLGVNDTTGIYQFSDFKGDPTYSPNSTTDEIHRIKFSPNYFGGIQNSIAYKSLSMSIFLQFVKQVGKNMIGLLNSTPGSNSLNVSTAFLNSWQEPGDKAKFEKFSQLRFRTPYNGLNFAKQSDFAFSDASFIRLKSIEIAWQIPELWKSKAHLQNARVFVQGQNLLTLTRYFGVDPETRSLNSAPKRIVTTGIQVSL